VFAELKKEKEIKKEAPKLSAGTNNFLLFMSTLSFE
jgi:hypothetical protein